MSKALFVILALIACPVAVSYADSTTAPASQPGVVDVKNTKCVVSPDDDIDPTLTSVYGGKLYHFCCKGCKGEFDKHPEQYVKALEADPKKFGIEK